MLRVTLQSSALARQVADRIRAPPREVVSKASEILRVNLKKGSAYVVDHD